MHFHIMRVKAIIGLKLNTQFTEFVSLANLGIAAFRIRVERVHDARFVLRFVKDLLFRLTFV